MDVPATSFGIGGGGPEFPFREREDVLLVVVAMLLLLLLSEGCMVENVLAFVVLFRFV